MKKTLNKSLLDFYKRSKQKTNNTSLEHCIRTTLHMLKKAKYCSLITHGDEGWCNSRLVQPIIETDPNDPDYFTIWVGTRIDLRKTDEIWSNAKVTLAFENTQEDANLVIYGNATIEVDTDIKTRYWKSFWRMFFPEGPRADDYVAIRIEPSHLEVLNFKRNITPEPFGLKSAKLVMEKGHWQMAT